MADMFEQADEVQEALGRTYGMPEVDDDDLQAELDALGDEIALDDDTSYLDDVVKAPEAPSREPGADSIVPGKVWLPIKKRYLSGNIYIYNHLLLLAEHHWNRWIWLAKDSHIPKDHIGQELPALRFPISIFCWTFRARFVYFIY